MGNNRPRPSGTPNKPEEKVEKVEKKVLVSVQEFFDTRLYSDNDKLSMQRMYGKAEKTTKENWEKILKTDFNEIK